PSCFSPTVMSTRAACTPASCYQNTSLVGTFGSCRKKGPFDVLSADWTYGKPRVRISFAQRALFMLRELEWRVPSLVPAQISYKLSFDDSVSATGLRRETLNMRQSDRRS